MEYVFLSVFVSLLFLFRFVRRAGVDLSLARHHDYFIILSTTKISSLGARINVNSPLDRY